MGNCEIFSVLGGFRKKSIFESSYIPGYKKYKEAIEYLKTEPNSFNLGWMGSGFEVLNPDYPCIIGSRALELMKDDRGIAIISWDKGT